MSTTFHGVTRPNHVLLRIFQWGNTSQVCLRPFMRKHVWMLWIVVFIEGCTCVETCGLDRRDKYAHNVWSFSAWRNVYVGPDKGRYVHETSSSSSLGNVYAFVCKWSGEAGNEKFHSVTGCLVSYDLLQCIVCLLLELATSFTVITSLSLASALTRKHLSRKSTWDALDDGSDASCRMISCNALFAAAWTTKGKSQLQGRSVIKNCFEAGQIVRWELVTLLLEIGHVMQWHSWYCTSFPMIGFWESVTLLWESVTCF